MLSKTRTLAFLLSLLTSTASFSDGKILKMWFAGPNDPNHPNIVQLQIENGYTTPNCDPTLAAIRISEANKPLISFAMTAYVTKTPVTVVLNSMDQYLAGRCTISRIATAN